ncbi:Cytochrome c-type biogenesis protein CcmH [Aquicella siphonis]|uniref:Cytochrome c-type biogenesis protein n=1 Tax=Aquicella siphonis TaxID=254247 RepID=A0A5E4PD81_9COXI|nr:cytochrome c-type biogenesis protein [Aquicella siphonis]VVC74869.1 Cytochrome c-type biogenesis protein CcmH [Aquicella siphonis]
MYKNPSFSYSSGTKRQQKKLRWLLKWLLFVLVLAVTPAFAAEQDAYPFSSAQDAQRFQLLTREIRCVVCQNQNIADSNAPLANDLRDKVYKMVTEQKTNDEIKNYLVRRYGEFILLSPPLNKSTLILWTFPFIGMAFIFFMLTRVMKRQKT